ncbi:MAG: hypothetical protein B7733_23150 [Myxococcales bacterium FL481]|nr:MAG: hypothetical protein B7733_23150 [Myxococcales bacterium FL481]
MTSFLFWQRWLLVLGIAFVVFGAVLTLPFGASMFDSLINPIFWGTEHIPPPANAFKLFVYGVLGAAMVGWGGLLAFIAYHPFRQKRPWAWKCLATVFPVWFVFGLYVSMRGGVYWNVVGDILFFLMVMMPVCFTRRDFANANKR